MNPKNHPDHLRRRHIARLLRLAGQGAHPSLRWYVARRIKTIARQITQPNAFERRLALGETKEETMKIRYTVDLQEGTLATLQTLASELGLYTQKPGPFFNTPSVPQLLEKLAAAQQQDELFARGLDLLLDFSHQKHTE